MQLATKLVPKRSRKTLKNKLGDYFQGRLAAKIKIEERKAQEKFSLSAVDYSRINIQSNEINKNVEIFNLKKDLAARRAKELKLIKENLEIALNTLTDEEYELIELSFSKENYTIRQVAANLCLAESTIANKRRELLDRLADLLGM